MSYLLVVGLAVRHVRSTIVKPVHQSHGRVLAGTLSGLGMGPLEPTLV